MPKFAYRVQDKSAQLMEGMLEAGSEVQAQKFLLDHHYEVLLLKPVKENRSLKDFLARFEKPNLVQFNFCIRQMATMLRAGVPLLPCIHTLQESTRDVVLKRVLYDVYNDIEQGTSFSQAIAKHPKAFGHLFVATVRSGEAIGELDTVLARLADILEKDYQTSSKVQSALRYPMFAGGVIIVAFLIATLFIIPKFKLLFASFGNAQLPLPTIILLTTSEVIHKYWYLVMIALTGIVAGVIYHYRTHSGRRFWDRILLSFPVFGIFIRNSVFSRFARMLGLMLKSGVNILQALELISEIVQNSIVSDSVKRVRERVSQGEGMAGQMSHEKIYPLLLVQMVLVGEESGRLDELLLQIAEFYDAELEVMTKNIETLIEPFFIVVLAGFVMMMALGIFLPMWNLFSVIQKAAA